MNPPIQPLQYRLHVTKEQGRRFYVEASNGEYYVYGGRHARRHKTTANLADATTSEYLTALKLLFGFGDLPVVDSDGRLLLSA